MKTGPAKFIPGATDFTAKAHEAWGSVLPQEIKVLAEACKARTATKVATELGYSTAVISTVISRKYTGDIGLVLRKIRGNLMGETRECPVMGEIMLDQCLRNQKKKFATTNSTSARLFNTCPTCPHNRRNEEKAQAALQAEVINDEETSDA